MGTDDVRKAAENLVMELRRGVIVLAALGRLKNEHYGYSLKKEMSELGLAVNEGTLYPLLRRLEQQGLLESRWALENGMRRRYYKLSANGTQTYEVITTEWQKLVEVMNDMMEKKEAL